MSQTDDCVIQVHDHKMSTTVFYFKRFLHVAAIQTWMIIIYIYCPAICHLCVSKLPYAGFQCAPAPYRITRILTPSCLYTIDIGYECECNTHPPLPHPPVFLPKVTRIFGPFLLVDGRALRQPATDFYWSTFGENRQLASIGRQANH
jgi:hypothetical protein